jgi:hypothetical protein
MPNAHHEWQAYSLQQLYELPSSTPNALLDSVTKGGIQKTRIRFYLLFKMDP